MINKTIAIYVFIDDLLKKLNHNEPENRNMSDAEIITTVLVSAIYFSGHHEKAMSYMKSTGMVTHMLSKSRFNRRFHQIRELVIDLFLQQTVVYQQSVNNLCFRLEFGNNFLCLVRQGFNAFLIFGASISARNTRLGKLLNRCCKYGI